MKQRRPTQRRPTEHLSAHRVIGAEVFNRLCALSGLTAVDLCHHLERDLDRGHELQPSTLRAWRTGLQAVPLDATLVVADLVSFRFPGVEVLLLGEQIDDPQRRREAFIALVNSMNEKRGPDPKARPVARTKRGG